MPFDAIKFSAISHIRENKFFPTIAELRETALTYMSEHKPLSIEEQEDRAFRRRVVLEAYGHEQKLLTD